MNIETKDAVDAALAALGSKATYGGDVEFMTISARC